MWIKQVHVYDTVRQEYKKASIRIQKHLITELLEDIPEKCSSDDVISFPDHYLYPGFIDSHCHLLGVGTSLLEKNIFETADPSDWVGHMQTDDRDDLLYRGWNEEKLGYSPTKQLLDSLPIHKPVLLTRKCGHAGVVNSKTLERYSLSNFHQVEGTDLTTGFLTEKALLSLRQQMQPKPALLEKAVEAATRYCHSMGISSVHSEDCSLSNMETLLPILRKTSLHLHEKILVNTPEEMDQVMEIIARYPDSDTFSFGSFKIYLDGSLGAHNAHLKEPYADRPNDRGFAFYSVDALIRLIQKANHYAKQLAIHVIGDEALEKCLQAFEYVMPLANSRMMHRLVHVQMASRSQLSRIQKLPLWINLQPVFAEADQQMATSRLGLLRLKEIGYPFQSVVSDKIPFSLSSDAPVETMNPFVILSHAERFMSRKEAFSAYSLAGAQQSHFPNQLGSLQAGSYADGFLLPCDLFRLSSSELSGMVPSYILANGEIFSINDQSERK